MWSSNEVSSAGTSKPCWKLLSEVVHFICERQKTKLVVTGAIGKDDLSVPEEFKKEIDEILKNNTITDETFLACCKAAVRFKQKYPEKRMGIAYTMAGIWLSARNTQQVTPLIEEIGSEFGSLELPDHHIEPNVDEGRRRVADLVQEKSRNFKL